MWPELQARRDGQVSIRVTGDLMPTSPLVYDTYTPAGFAADQSFYHDVCVGSINPIKGDIACFVADGVQLLDGRMLEGFDTLVLATGYQCNDYSWLPPATEQLLGAEEDGLYLYRHVLPHRVPGLAFVGTEAHTFNGVLTPGLQAEWLARALNGKILLPSVEDQEADVAGLKQYKWSWMPASNRRAMTLGLHDIYYHDQLVEDAGLPSHPHGWNILAECFLPKVAAEYRHVFRASAEEAAGTRNPPPRRPPKVNRPTAPDPPCEKVEMLYGGITAEALIKKGILSHPGVK